MDLGSDEARPNFGSRWADQTQPSALSQWPLPLTFLADNRTAVLENNSESDDSESEMGDGNTDVLPELWENEIGSENNNESNRNRETMQIPRNGTRMTLPRSREPPQHPTFRLSALRPHNASSRQSPEVAFRCRLFSRNQGALNESQARFNASARRRQRSESPESLEQTQSGRRSQAVQTQESALSSGQRTHAPVTSTGSPQPSAAPPMTTNRLPSRNPVINYGYNLRPRSYGNTPVSSYSAVNGRRHSFSRTAHEADLSAGEAAQSPSRKRRRNETTGRDNPNAEYTSPRAVRDRHLSDSKRDVGLNFHHSLLTLGLASHQLRTRTARPLGDDRINLLGNGNGRLP